MNQYLVEALSLGVGAREDERRFVWLQRPEFVGARVRIAPLALYERDGGFTEENCRIVFGATTLVKRDEPFLSCKVRVDGLAPDTAYVYSVGCDSGFDAEIYTFRMPDLTSDRRSFFMIADLHINVYRRPFHKHDPDGKKAMARFENTLASARGYNGTAPDFMLSLGDNICVANMGASMFPEPEKFTKRLSADYVFAEHREFLMPRALKEIPMASVQGNHDSVNLDAGADPVGDGNNVFFDLPNDDGYSGRYLEGSSATETISSGNFWFVSGDLLVVGINAMVSTGGNRIFCTPEVHRAFIEKAIAAAGDVRWRILLTHVPAYSYVEGASVRAAGTTCGTPDAPTETAQMAEFFNDLCDPYGFDVVFTGHQHAFSRTYPLIGGKPVGEDARKVEAAVDGTVTETLTRPHGVIHYNVPSAYDHSFLSNLPEDPAALYAAYGVKTYNLMEAIEKKILHSDKFAGITYNSATYTHVTVEREGDAAVMTISSVRSDNSEAFDTLIIRK